MKRVPYSRIAEGVLWLSGTLFIGTAYPELLQFNWLICNQLHFNRTNLNNHKFIQNQLQTNGLCFQISNHNI